MPLRAVQAPALRAPGPEHRTGAGDLGRLLPGPEWPCRSCVVRSGMDDWFDSLNVDLASPLDIWLGANRLSRQQERCLGMTIASILKEKGDEVVSVTPATLVSEIASIISSRRIGAVVVLAEAERLAGIVSERDVVKAIAANGELALQLTAAEIMTKAVVTASPQTSVDEAMAVMNDGYFRHLPVVTDGVLVGIISVRDVVRAHIQQQTQEVDSLKDYVFRGSQTGGLR